MVHLLSRSSLGTSSSRVDLGRNLSFGHLVRNDLLQYESRPVDLCPMRERCGQSSSLLHHRSVLLFEYCLSVFVCLLHDLSYSNLELFLLISLPFNRREQFNLRRNVSLSINRSAELQFSRHDPLGSSDHQEDRSRRNHLHFGKRSIDFETNDVCRCLDHGSSQCHSDRFDWI